ncbi:MAG: GNAT family N-acetyltransferase [Gelidibacter sp.]
MNDLVYTYAKLSDALRLSLLFQTVYVQTYGDEGITFETTNYLTQRFSVAHIEKTIQKDPSQLIVAYKHNNPIGVAELYYNSVCPIRQIPICELDKFYVMRQFHGHGIGYGLLKAAESEVRAKGHGQLFLQVYDQNPKAIAFYKRQGYTIIGEADFAMEAHTYVNFVMTKVL